MIYLYFTLANMCRICLCARKRLLNMGNMSFFRIISLWQHMCIVHTYRRHRHKQTKIVGTFDSHIVDSCSQKEKKEDRHTLTHFSVHLKLYFHICIWYVLGYCAHVTCAQCSLCGSAFFFFVRFKSNQFTGILYPFRLPAHSHLFFTFLCSSARSAHNSFTFSLASFSC